MIALFFGGIFTDALSGAVAVLIGSTGLIGGYLQDQLGQRIAAHLVGLRDAKQIGHCRCVRSWPTSAPS